MPEQSLEEMGYESAGIVHGFDLPGAVKEMMKDQLATRYGELRVVYIGDQIRGCFGLYLLNRDTPPVSTDGFEDAGTDIPDATGIDKLIVDIIRLNTYPTAVEEIPAEFRLIRDPLSGQYRIFGTPLPEDTASPDDVAAEYEGFTLRKPIEPPGET